MGVRPLPISRDEFARMFRKCVPPVGWTKDIGVANSGGPDSTCLLFLIHRYLTDNSSQEQPCNVVSLTVDHDLQPTSAAMAEHSCKFAQSLGLQHITSKIPWSKPPFPPRPADGQPFESIARTARYLSLFQAMTQKNVSVIAFGQHADDQVETSLMRLSWGSTAIGAGGMRPCRRWGMGMDQGASGFLYGYEGMNRWIVRPLLDVGKERIIATCQENKLEYVTDPTNFQPSATLRNAIRHEILQNNTDDQPQAGQPLLDPGIVERLRTLEKSANSLKDVSLSLDSSPEELRSAVSILSSNVQDIDDEVDSILKRCSLPTIPGTFLISSHGIRRIHDPMIQRALVLRLMRFVSYHPWGSMRADASRRKDNISQIVNPLWRPIHAGSILRPFTAGGGVLWTPVFVKGSFIKTPGSVVAAAVRDDERLGWLASRQPQMHRLKLQERGLPNRLEIDATKTIVEALRLWTAGGTSVVTVLYDCRFLVRFDLAKMPEDLVRHLSNYQGEKIIMLYSRTRWYWPHVVLEGNDFSEVLHDEISEKATNPFLDTARIHVGSKDRQMTPIDSGWISIEWIRPLTAL